MRSLRHDNRGVAFAIVAILLTIFCVTFVWYVCNEAFLQIQTSMRSTMTPYENDTAYTAWEQADTFIAYIWQFFIVLLFLGLMLFGYYYAQHKGQPYGGF